MLFIRWVKVEVHERGLVFKDGDLVQVLGPGRHVFFDLWLRTRVYRVSVRDVCLAHPDLDVIVKSGLLEGEARTLELNDHERALMWTDGRFSRVLGPGRHVLWTVFHQVRVEVIDARSGRLEHPELPVVLASAGALGHLEAVTVEAGSVGLLYRDGRLETQLPPGVHALWRGVGRQKVVAVDLREQTLDVAGQEIMSADKVSLRLNAVVTWKVADAPRAAQAVDDFRQALYRESQLALRATVGTREIDALLEEKDAVAAELHRLVSQRAAGFGVEVVGLGIRDVILPGDMRLLMNRVTEARKAAEANLITRREETAAMRSQANTARLLDAHPTLMKLRELEVLEKVADKAKLEVVLTDTGLTDRVMKLI